MPDYLWVAEDGLKMQGYNGSQCWDTCFALQAVSEAGLCGELPQMVAKGWRFLERTQILSTDASCSTGANAFESAAQRRRYYRHVSRGGWPFSTSAHGWPISDVRASPFSPVLSTARGVLKALISVQCTAEGLKTVLELRGLPQLAGCVEPISDERLHNAINVILTLQNSDGGWATYEK